MEGGLKRALEDRSWPGHPAKLDERGEAHLIALAKEAPQGPTTGPYGCWQALVAEIVPSMSHEGIRSG